MGSEGSKLSANEIADVVQSIGPSYAAYRNVIISSSISGEMVENLSVKELESLLVEVLNVKNQLHRKKIIQLFKSISGIDESDANETALEDENKGEMAGFDFIRATNTAGFSFSQNNSVIRFPNGPQTVFSDTTLSQQSRKPLFWNFVAKGNSSWCVGAVPVDKLDVPGYLFEQGAFGLSNSGLSGGVFDKVSMHNKLVYIFVDPANQKMLVSIDGIEERTWELPSQLFPLKLGVCGFNGTKIKLFIEGSEEDEDSDSSGIELPTELAHLLQQLKDSGGKATEHKGLLEHLMMKLSAEDEDEDENGVAVNIRVKPILEVQQLQRGHGGFVDDMETALGMKGRLIRVDKDGDMVVRLTSGPRLGSKYCWNSQMIEFEAGALPVGSEVMLVAGLSRPDGPLDIGDVGKIIEHRQGGKSYVIVVCSGMRKDTSGIYSKDAVCPVWKGFNVNQDGRRVQIRAVTSTEAQQAQDGCGGWCSVMERCLGRRGVVIETTPHQYSIRTDNGDVWAWAPSLVEFENPAERNRFPTGSFVVSTQECKTGSGIRQILRQGDVGIVVQGGKQTTNPCTVLNLATDSQGWCSEAGLRFAQNSEITTAVRSEKDVKVGRFYKLVSCESPCVPGFFVGDTVFVKSTSETGGYKIKICKEMSSEKIRAGHCHWNHLEMLDSRTMPTNRLEQLHNIPPICPSLETQDSEVSINTCSTPGAHTSAQENLLCCICMENPKTIAVIPCGHLCLCQNCSPIISDECPICRGNIASKVNIYL